MGFCNRAEQVKVSRSFRGMRRALLIVACAASVPHGGAFAQTDSEPAAKVPRIVAPQLIAPPDVAPSDLQRIEPRPPLGGTLGAQPGDAVEAAPKRPPLGTKLLRADPLLFKPVAEQAGVITAEGRTITLAGIEPLPVDEMCGADPAAHWPCGMIARTSFRNFLRGRAVRCEFPDGDVPEKVTVPCRLGNRDLAEWLVANGWVRATADTYKEQAKSAEDAKRGVFGPPPQELAASLRNQPASPSGSTSLPSGKVSILPADPEPAPTETPQAAVPPAVAPQSAGSVAPEIQSAPLPPPSQPQVE